MVSIVKVTDNFSGGAMPINGSTSKATRSFVYYETLCTYQ